MIYKSTLMLRGSRAINKTRVRNNTWILNFCGERKEKDEEKNGGGEMKNRRTEKQGKKRLLVIVSVISSRRRYCIEAPSQSRVSSNRAHHHSHAND